jgi:uncharacterized Zn-finger protein
MFKKFHIYFLSLSFLFVSPRNFWPEFILFYPVVYMLWILSYECRRYIIRQRRVGTVRWHQCSYCSKEFKKPSDLVRHIRIHTHERPYKVTKHLVQKSEFKFHKIYANIDVNFTIQHIYIYILFMINHYFAVRIKISVLTSWNGTLWSI